MTVHRILMNSSDSLGTPFVMEEIVSTHPHVELRVGNYIEGEALRLSVGLAMQVRDHLDDFIRAAAGEKVDTHH